MQVFNRQVSIRGLTVFGFEAVLIAGSILVAAVMHGAPTDNGGVIWRTLIATTMYQLCFYYNDLYDLTLVDSQGEILERVLQATGAGAIALAVVSVVVPSLMIGYGIFVTSLGLTLIAVPLWRYTFDG
ncbi:MAG TPA: hypothetical protein VGY48_02065, partial [Vicinamibacterales bacterium]|nr:hypothetical protein [Vicinamibacterales bacterium]